MFLKTYTNSQKRDHDFQVSYLAGVFLVWMDGNNYNNNNNDSNNENKLY